jgi:hypothetical protein
LVLCGAVLVLLLAPATPAWAQPAPDYTTVEGIMTELYASVTRAPGAPFEWDRLRAIMLPGGIMVPQRRQTQGETRIMDVEAFIAWIDNGWRPIIGTPQDLGFYERQTNLIVEQFGDIAHAFTTYEKGPYEPRRLQASGINSVQLVKRDGRWYILSITWDEENSGGPLPPKYRGQ